MDDLGKADIRFVDGVLGLTCVERFWICEGLNRGYG